MRGRVSADALTEHSLSEEGGQTGQHGCAWGGQYGWGFDVRPNCTEECGYNHLVNRANAVSSLRTGVCLVPKTSEV